MVNEFHELELAVGTLGVRDVLEGPRQFLDRDILLRHRVVRGAVQSESQVISGTKARCPFERT